MKQEAVLQHQFSIKLRRSDTSEIDGIVSCVDISLLMSALGENLITLEFEGRSLSGHANDYFEAFDKIRLELEPEGIFPIINGANRNCYPSGMARDMGAGLSVYQLTLGKPGATKDLVKTFESNAITEIVSVQEQKSYYQQWLTSLSQKA